MIGKIPITSIFPEATDILQVMLTLMPNFCEEFSFTIKRARSQKLCTRELNLRRKHSLPRYKTWICPEESSSHTFSANFSQEVSFCLEGYSQSLMLVQEIHSSSFLCYYFFTKDSNYDLFVFIVYEWSTEGCPWRAILGKHVCCVRSRGWIRWHDWGKHLFYGGPRCMLRATFCCYDCMPSRLCDLHTLNTEY